MFSGVLIVGLGFVWDSKKTFIAFLVLLTLVSLALELSRLLFPSFNQVLLRCFGFLAREHEHKEVSGIFYYCLGCCLSAIVFPKFVALLAILYLAFGDPVAAVVGVLFGRTPAVSNADIDSKSVEGSLACFAVCFLLTLGGSYAFEGLTFASFSHRFIFACLGGGAAMIGELIPLKTDDNFAIPIVSGALLWLTAALLNLVPGLYLN